MPQTILTSYGCFTHWWAVLPAIPPNHAAVDWWAPQDDGRCSRYGRLKRVWFDSTRLLSPKSNPCRPHEFAKPTHGTHLTCKTWESFVLYDPGAWIPRLLAAAGIECPFHPVDCAWSYEFEAMVGLTSRFKLADIVLHVRGHSGEELLVVVEVKRPGDKLKETGDLPDARPASYLDREVFLAIPNRRLVYLVDARYAPMVRQKVLPSDRRWGVLTWAQLAGLQHTLAGETFPEPLGEFVRMVHASQYAGQGISDMSSPIAADLQRLDQFLRPESLGAWRTRLAQAGPLPEYLAQFVMGSFQYLTCLRGVRPETLAFDYLGKEPSFEQIHWLPDGQRQRTAERRQALWRLPPPQK